MENVGEAQQFWEWLRYMGASPQVLTGKGLIASQTVLPSEGSSGVISTSACTGSDLFVPALPSDQVLGSTPFQINGPL